MISDLSLDKGEQEMKRFKAFLVIGAGVWVLSIMVGNGASAMLSTIPGDGAATFKAKCATCHGVDGSGNTPIGKNMKVRDLGSAAVQAQSDAQLTKIIANGKKKMPGFGSSLGGSQISELVAHIRSMKK
jgi:mono/diheme cytochrome c family protein